MFEVMAGRHPRTVPQLWWWLWQARHCPTLQIFSSLTVSLVHSAPQQLEDAANNGCSGAWMPHKIRFRSSMFDLKEASVVVIHPPGLKIWRVRIPHWLHDGDAPVSPLRKECVPTPDPYPQCWNNHMVDWISTPPYKIWPLRPLEHQNGIIWYRTLTSHEPIAIPLPLAFDVMWWMACQAWSRMFCVISSPSIHGSLLLVLTAASKQAPGSNAKLLATSETLNAIEATRSTNRLGLALESSLKYHVSDLFAKPTESETLDVHVPDRKDTKYQADATWQKMSSEITKYKVMPRVCSRMKEFDLSNYMIPKRRGVQHQESNGKAHLSLG